MPDGRHLRIWRLLRFEEEFHKAGIANADEIAFRYSTQSRELEVRWIDLREETRGNQGENTPMVDIISLILPGGMVGDIRSRSWDGSPWRGCIFHTQNMDLSVNLPLFCE